MCQVLQSVWRVVWWILSIPLWAILVVAFVVGIVCLIWFLYFAQHGETTKPEDDTPIDRIVDVAEPIDAFRADWDIRGRFETWPALLPLAEMSKVAYSSEDEANPLFQRFGFDSVVPIKSPFHSHWAYVAHGKDVLIVVFRGTDEKEDWLSNANVYPHRMAEGDMHSGFGSAYATLRCQLWREIEKTEPKHIWVTGHSLGGAMALVCAYDLEVYRGRRIDGVITFGQPRIGNQELATNLQKRLGDHYVRFVNESDPFPLIPRSFDHCGLFLRFVDDVVEKSSDYCRMVAMSEPKDNIRNDYEYVPVDELPEIGEKELQEFMQIYEQKHQQFQAPSPGPLKAYGMSYPWGKDHSMESYVEKIRDAIEKATGR